MLIFAVDVDVAIVVGVAVSVYDDVAVDAGVDMYVGVLC